ncbi:MAG: ROK family glucokinase [Lachnospiraceae bacterium]|nr:ROK family glucokinase [Lachnospiraceae bacterium]
MKYLFGIDIGGTTVKCGLFTEDGKLTDKWEIPTDRTDKGANILRDVVKAIRDKAAEKKIEEKDIIGIGMGVPGPVLADGTVNYCPNLGWEIVNVKKVMAEMINVPVAVGNDANVAALGEAVFGGGRDYDSILMVTLGTGVGGGLVINRKIVCGSNGAAAEIGHIIVNPDESAVCGCGGHGHLEQYASATGIVRLAKKKLLDETLESSLRAFVPLTAKDIFDEAKKGDKVAIELTEELGKYLALALTHVAAVADPQAFVIGGGVSRAGVILTETIERHYNENILRALKGKKFMLAELGNDAGIYGAMSMIEK